MSQHSNVLRSCVQRRQAGARFHLFSFYLSLSFSISISISISIFVAVLSLAFEQALKLRQINLLLSLEVTLYF